MCAGGSHAGAFHSGRIRWTSNPPADGIPDIVVSFLQVYCFDADNRGVAALYINAPIDADGTERDFSNQAPTGPWNFSSLDIS